MSLYLLVKAQGNFRMIHALHTDTHIKQYHDYLWGNLTIWKTYCCTSFSNNFMFDNVNTLPLQKNKFKKNQFFFKSVCQIPNPCPRAQYN